MEEGSSFVGGLIFPPPQGRGTVPGLRKLNNDKDAILGERAVPDHSEFDRAKQIRQRMSYIRRELNDGMERVEQDARTLLNWRYYTSNYPWACVGVAAAIGYLVVPRKLEIHSPDPKTLEKLARKRHLVVEQRPKAEAKGGLVGTAFSFISGIVLKTAMVQLGHQLASMFDQNKERDEQQPTPPSSPPPVQPRTPGRPHLRPSQQ
jgi:ElaB/YqjD/DUF883 family membrane-anchored ribosome-binding protein